MKVGTIIQARMSSSRLPGKILMPLLGKTVIENVYENACKSELTETVVIATSFSKADDPVFDLCKNRNIPVIRGDEEDVASRFLDCAKEYCFDIVNRICADSPFVDSIECDRLIDVCLNSDASFCYNSFDDNIPYGMGSHVFRTEDLKKAYKEGLTQPQKEHVTQIFYDFPEKYCVLQVKARESLRKRMIRVVLDYSEDYELLKKITAHFINRLPGSEELLDFLDSSGFYILNSMHEAKY